MSRRTENTRRSNHSIFLPQNFGSPFNDMSEHIAGLGLARLDFERGAVAGEVIYTVEGAASRKRKRVSLRWHMRSRNSVTGKTPPNSMFTDPREEVLSWALVFWLFRNSRDAHNLVILMSDTLDHESYVSRHQALWRKSKLIGRQPVSRELGFLLYSSY